MTLTAAAPCPPSCVPEWQLFRQLLPPTLLNDLDPKAAQTVYTPYVVTWLLLYQRLNGNATLNDAVSELTLRFPAQALPACKRVRDGCLSSNTGAYSLARRRLDCRVLYWAAQNVFDSLVASYPPSWHGRRAFFIDGSTLSLPATRALRHAFPPARNQHGPSAWPVLHLAVAHELQSGLALWPQCGAMYGPNAVSEITLAQGLLGRLPQNSILLADRNFGIFAFAYAAVQARHDVLLRLTQKRFLALARKAQPAGPGRWQLSWRPSRHDRKVHPELPADAHIEGWLHEVAVSPQRMLWLFETVAGSGPEMAGLYGQRLNVETDIRDLKETLLVGALSGQSVALVEKEILAAVLAYNLANQVRRLAAARRGVPPRRLSFAGVWSLVKTFLGQVLDVPTLAQAEAQFERLLRGAGQRLLPRRPKGRSYPREVIPRRRKFPERQRPSQPAAP